MISGRTRAQTISVMQDPSALNSELVLILLPKRPVVIYFSETIVKGFFAADVNPVTISFSSLVVPVLNVIQ